MPYSKYYKWKSSSSQIYSSIQVFQYAIFSKSTEEHSLEYYSILQLGYILHDLQFWVLWMNFVNEKKEWQRDNTEKGDILWVFLMLDKKQESVKQPSDKRSWVKTT